LTFSIKYFDYRTRKTPWQNSNGNNQTVKNNKCNYDKVAVNETKL